MPNIDRNLRPLDLKTLKTQGSKTSSQEKKLAPPETLFEKSINKDKADIKPVFQGQEIQKISFVEGTQLPAKIIDADPRNPYQILNLKPGEKFALRLNANASTGYQWKFDHHSALKPTGKTYIPDHKGPGMPPPGSGGDLYYIFEAPKKGQTHIALDHGRGGWMDPTNTHYRFDIQTENEPLIPKKVLDPNPQNPTQHLSLKPGEKFAIRVDSNGSTGYSWEFGEQSLKPDRTYTKPHHTGQGMAPPGSGHTVYYIFTAPEQGEVSLGHGQQWDQNSVTQYQFKIN